MRSTMKQCPFCAEEVQDAAVYCKHCHRDLPGAATFASTSFPAPHSAWEAEARKLALEGKMIEAIKKVREGTGLGLAEAKAKVDRWRQESPNAAPPQRSGGCGLVLVLLVLIGAALAAAIMFAS
jgi:hypothetical protein